MNPVSQAFDLFLNRSKNFVFPPFAQLALALSFLLAFIGLYFIISGIFGMLNILPGNAYIIALGVVSLIYIILLSGIKGAWVKGIIDALEGRRIKLYNYIRFSVSKALPLFGIILIKFILLLILFSPLIYLYITNSDLLSSQTTVIALALIYLIIVFFVEYLFYLAFPIYVAFERSFISSIVSSFNLSIRHVTKFLPLFILMGFVFLTNFIPIVNLITYFMLYPIVYSAFLIQLAAYESELSVQHVKKKPSYKGRRR